MSPVHHELTVETTRQPDGRYRVVGTCSCLHFARSGTALNRGVAEYAVDVIDGAHLDHLAAMESGLGAAPQVPEWLA